MRKIVKITAVAALFAILLTACGGAALKGTYKSEGFISQTWTFSGSNKVTLSAGGGLVTSHGTYRIDGDTLYITSELLGTTTTSSYTITEIKSKSFFIDGEKFTKQ